MAVSKALGHDDTSGFEFVKRVLGDNATAAVNFDRLQKDPQKGYIIFEFLKCEENQTVTPYTSHPKNYWNKNSSKFLSLWRACLDFGATLYLVNYADKDTEHEDEVLLIEVIDMDENGITKEKITEHTMETFTEWFVNMNERCLAEKEKIVLEIYNKKTIDELGKITLRQGKHMNETIETIYHNDYDYLKWHSKQKYEYSQASMCYLQKAAEMKNNDPNK